MNKESTYYIGIMSGTSVDGIDIALVKQDSFKTQFINGAEFEFEPQLRLDVLALCKNQQTSLQALGEITQRLSTAYGNVVNQFLADHNINPAQITAIGCHGQTVFHQPTGKYPFSMQLINPSVIAALTGITLVSDFRSMDVALGGQGAPLVPLFHQSLITEENSDRGLVFLNLGGIANISIVNPAPLVGYDTGPANVLLDAWILKTQNKHYDKDGAFAGSGQLNHMLLTELLAEPYFQLLAPKSTGRELFNLDWLQSRLERFNQPISDADIMATLVHLTCTPIIESIKHLSPGQLLVCGGGAKNQTIMQCLAAGLPGWAVRTTDDAGISSDYMEAMAFAWLAYRCINRLPGNDPLVTGSSRAELCGSITRVKSSY